MEYWECVLTGGQLYSYCAFSNEGMGKSFQNKYFIFLSQLAIKISFEF
jgi:hypothetical protein